MSRLAAILLVLTATLARADTENVREIHLVPTTRWQQADGILIERPLFKCGEVVRTVHEPGALFIVWDRKWAGREWTYRLRRTSYATAKGTR